MKKEMSDQELIQLLRKKNKEAIHTLYVRFSPVFLAICMRYFKDRDQAKDCMHDGFMKILNAMASFKDQGSFEGWMKRIMVNNALDYLKLKQKQWTEPLEETLAPATEVEEDTEVDLSDVDQDKPEIGFVRNAGFSTDEILAEVYKLPDKYRLVFMLFVLENFSHAAIAKKLNIDEKASRTRLNRSRTMVKQALYKKSISRLAK